MTANYKYNDDYVEVDYDYFTFKNDYGNKDFEFQINHIWDGDNDLIHDAELRYNVEEFICERIREDI